MVPFVRDELQHVGVGIWPFQMVSKKKKKKRVEGKSFLRKGRKRVDRLRIIRSNPPLPRPSPHTPLHIVVLACLGE